jgi:hypothetical protein
MKYGGEHSRDAPWLEPHRQECQGISTPLLLFLIFIGMLIVSAIEPLVDALCKLLGGLGR